MKGISSNAIVWQISGQTRAWHSNGMANVTSLAPWHSAYHKRSWRGKQATAISIAAAWRSVSVTRAYRVASISARALLAARCLLAHAHSNNNAHLRAARARLACQHATLSRPAASLYSASLKRTRIIPRGVARMRKTSSYTSTSFARTALRV